MNAKYEGPDTSMQKDKEQAEKYLKICNSYFKTTNLSEMEVAEKFRYYKLGIDERHKIAKWVPTPQFMLQGAKLDHEIGYITIQSEKPELCLYEFSTFKRQAKFYKED